MLKVWCDMARPGMASGETEGSLGILNALRDWVGIGSIKSIASSCGRNIIFMEYLLELWK